MATRNAFVFEYRGVKIYRVSRDDGQGDGYHKYGYSIAPNAGELDRDSFDIRSLMSIRGYTAADPADHRAIIKAAIDAGVIKPDVTF